MQKDKMKAKWNQPKHTILVRDNNQERILSLCKYSGIMPIAQENWWQGCDFLMFDQQGHGRECRNCSMRQTS